jgi:hypothetical protein
MAVATTFDRAISTQETSKTQAGTLDTVALVGTFIGAKGGA